MTACECNDQPVLSGDGKRTASAGAEALLRIYLLQRWYNPLYPAGEDALYGSQVMRQCARVDMGREPVPDET